MFHTTSQGSADLDVARYKRINWHKKNVRDQEGTGKAKKRKHSENETTEREKRSVKRHKT